MELNYQNISICYSLVSFIITFTLLIFIHILVTETTSPSTLLFWAFFFNSILCIFLVTEHSYLLTFVVIYSCWINFCLLVYLKIRQEKEELVLKKLLTKQSLNQEYLQLKEFWNEDFPKRKHLKVHNKVW